MQHKKRPPSRNPREQAARVVARFLDTGAFPDREIEQVREHRAVIMEITYGTIRYLRLLRWMLEDMVAHMPATRIEALLLTGMYQLIFMDRTEDYAIVNESVDIARHIRDSKAASFVNAILRRTTREREQLLQKARAAEPGIRLSHPERLLQRWVTRFGEQRAYALCALNNRRPEVVIHVRRACIAPDDYARRLADKGIEAQPHPFGDGSFFRLGKGVAVQRLPGYAEGWFTVQDPATSMAVDLLEPQKGERILDACAAPGGKTALIADRVGPSGNVVAMDLHADRIQQLEANTKRLQLPQCDILQADFTKTGTTPLSKKGPFDAVLVDAPCTNTGVLRRRPDARWRFTAERMEQLVVLQKKLILAAAKHVKPGGRIVYSTCSLEPEENAQTIAEVCRRGLQLEKEQELFPPETNTDGAYAARLTVSK
jgi:16S rRNA (cytosine967-C5)-methyltransferase